MNILFIGSAPVNQDKIIFDTMEEHVVSAFEKLDVNCEYINYQNSKLFSFNLSRTLDILKTNLKIINELPIEKEILNKIKKNKPDMILILLGNYTPPDLIHKIKKISTCPVTVWCQDHLGTMHRQYLIAGEYDYLFFKDEYMVELFRSYTNFENIFHLPEACNPEIHTPANTHEIMSECDIAVAGTLYYYRAEILANLKDYKLKIWGNVPKFYIDKHKYNLLQYHQKKPIYTEDKAKIFRQSKIVLNTLFPTEIHSVNVRCFEAAGCGAFQLITHNKAISKYFEIGKEIETFKNIGELREKIDYYLEHENERIAIANAAYKRACKEHTYEIRLKKMIETVFSH